MAQTQTDIDGINMLFTKRVSGNENVLMCGYSTAIS